MPGSYELALFIHILGVFTVAGALTTFVLIIAMMRRAKNVQEVRLWGGIASKVQKLFPVAVIVLLLSGVFLVEDKNLEWGNGWINVSLITLLAHAVVGPLINTRKINAIERAANAAPDGALPQVLAAQISDPVLFGATHALTLAVIAIIWNMTVKPGDAQAGMVVVLAIALGALSALPMAMKQQSVLEREG